MIWQVLFALLCGMLGFLIWLFFKCINSDDYDGVTYATLTVIGILACAFFMVVTWFAAHPRPVPGCTAAAGQMIQWQGHKTGKNPEYWSFVRIAGDNDHFCKVYSKALYDMGIGYTLGRNWTGELKDRP